MTFDPTNPSTWAQSYFPDPQGHVLMVGAIMAVIIFLGICAAFGARWPRGPGRF